MVEESMDGYGLTVVQEIIETADLELEIQSETDDGEDRRRL